VTGERILVVEDDPEQVEFLLTNVLLPRQHLAQIASSGEAGLRAAKKRRPDLVLLDVTLPDLSPAEMLGGLQSAGSPPVIILIPAGAEATALQTIRRGACTALVKPIDAAEAAHEIQRVLHQQRLSHEQDWLLRKLAATNETLETTLVQLRMVHEIGRGLRAETSPAELFRIAVDAAVAITNADEAYLLSHDPLDSSVYLRAVKLQDGAHLFDLYVPVNDNIASHVIKSGEPVILSGKDRELINPSLSRALGTGHIPARSLVNIALRDQRGVIGVLGAISRDPELCFSDGDVTALTALADLVGVALQNAEVYCDTERKLTYVLAEVKSAKRMTDLVMYSATDGMFTVDAEYRITSANPTFERITGWTAKELVGHRFDEIFAPRRDTHGFGNNDSRTTALLDIDALVTADGMTIQRKDKRRICLNSEATPLLSDNGVMTGILGKIRELEPRPPTGGQKEPARPAPSPKNRQFQQILEETLDALPIQTAPAAVDCHPITVRPIITQVVEAFECGGSGRRFKVAVDPDLPFAVGNENQTELALVNLIDVLLLQSPCAEPIRIGAAVSGQHIAILIEDPIPNGRQGDLGPENGLVIEAQSKTSEKAEPPLWWAIPQVKLFTARKLIEAQDGQLWSEFQAGTGLRFHVRLPIIEVNDVAEALAD
jgi:PAS domain S-box-containing protein